MNERRKFRLRLPTRTLILGGRTLVMGVLNVTPDSFSDGGEFLEPGRAVEHALEMEQAGADLLDIGGATTRAGAAGAPGGGGIEPNLPGVGGPSRGAKRSLSPETHNSHA